MRTRLLYALAGYAVAALVGWAVGLATGHAHVWNFALVGGPLAVWIGERTKRLEPVETFTRPITLFPNGIPGPPRMS